MKPTEEKTRENIVTAKQRGEKREEIAYWLNVSISTIDKIWRRFKETKSYASTPYVGRKSKINAATDEKIRAAIQETPDITLEKMIEKLSLPLTVSGLRRKLNRMGISYKKRHFIQKNSNGRTSKKNVSNGKTPKKS